MRVVFATAELAPIAAVGGLAQAAAGLTTELRRQGVEVDIVLPDYGAAELADERIEPLAVPEWAGPVSIRSGVHPVAGRLHLVSSPSLKRSHPYLQPDGSGWPDNTERFMSFSAAIAAYVAARPPDVLHLNDWHTGAALAAVDPSVPSVLSLHNLAYQGTTDGSWLTRIGPRADHFEWYGGTNPLSGAIALADAVVAVSPTYATEILTPAGGFGLDGALRNRWAAVSGILNGIDDAAWDPATDRSLVANYSATGTAGDRNAAKAANRAEVASRVGWVGDDTVGWVGDDTVGWVGDDTVGWVGDDGRPLAVMVTRLTDQKGVDVVTPIVAVLDDLPMRLVVLGTGEAVIASELRDAAAAHPESFAFVEAYDDDFAHLLFGAADVYLMPSRFEPCGLAQMQAMRYGALPVVTDVGGLHDTVVDADRHRNGTGFVAPAVTGAAVTAALFRASRRLSNRRQRESMVRRAMRIDWSWREPVRRYIALYERLIASPSVDSVDSAPVVTRGAARPPSH